MAEIDLAQFVSDYMLVLKESGEKQPPIFQLRNEITDAYLEATDPDATMTGEQIRGVKDSVMYYLS
jgi:hypothetical protein